MAQPQYNIFQDWRMNKNNVKGRLLLLMFRIARLLRCSGTFVFILGLPYLILYRILVEWFLCVELPWNLEIGENTQLYHGHSLVVHDHTKIGNNATLRQCTTIGAKLYSDGNFYSPIIGDNVDIGSNVVILGNVHIGNNAIIGAGSVVVKDVPEEAVVGGNPAKILYVRSTNSDLSTTKNN